MTKYKDEIVRISATLSQSAIDLSGDDNHGTLNDVPVIADTGEGGTHAFDMGYSSSDQKTISFADLTASIVGPGATLLAWMKCENHTPANITHTGGWRAGDAANLDTHYAYTNGQIYDDTFSDARYQVGDVGVADRSQWHMVTITRTTNSYKFYSNAILVYSNTDTDPFTFPTDFRFGWDADPTTKPDYLVDSIWLAPSEWSAAEILEVFKAGRNFNPGSVFAKASHRWDPSIDDVGNGTVTLVDQVGSLDCTLQDMDPATDWVDDGGGLRRITLDGNNDWAKSDLIPAKTVTKETMSWWVNRLTGEYAHFNRGQGSSNSPGWGFELYPTVSYLNFGTASVSPAPYAQVSHTQANDTWEHHCLVYDGSGTSNEDKIQYYVDAVAKTLSFTNNVPASLSWAADNYYEIGRRRWSTAYADCDFDGVVIFDDTALTAFEVTELHGFGRGYLPGGDLSLTLPTTVPVGSSVPATVSRIGVTTAALSVTLASDDAAATVASSVAIPAGQSDAVFAVNGIADGEAVISVSATGATGDSDTITVGSGNTSSVYENMEARYAASITDSAADSSPLGLHDGTYQSGLATVADTSNNGTRAYDLNGSGHSILLPHDSDFSPGDDDYTITAWVKPSAVNSKQHWIYADYGNASGNSSRVLLSLGSDNRFHGSFRDDSGFTLSATAS